MGTSSVRLLRATLRVVLLPLLVSACSTVPPLSEGRQGLLDRLGKPVSGARSPAALPPVSDDELRAESFQWPLRNVTITSPYGRRNDGFHEGIDLRAPSGTPVYAADSGTVIYADRRIRGYGRMVVIRHSNGLTTVYAHNSKLHVRKGQKVKRGQKIALSGKSGRATGPHLHFEVRNGVSPVDPSRVLPTASVAQAVPVPASAAGKSLARSD